MKARPRRPNTRARTDRYAVAEKVLEAEHRGFEAGVKAAGASVVGLDKQLPGEPEPKPKCPCLADRLAGVEMSLARLDELLALNVMPRLGDLEDSVHGMRRG